MVLTIIWGFILGYSFHVSGTIAGAPLAYIRRDGIRERLDQPRPAW